MPFLVTIILPIVGNAAEHASAVVFAYKVRAHGVHTLRCPAWPPCVGAQALLGPCSLRFDSSHV